jgi:hypothetical protein
MKNHDLPNLVREICEISENALGLLPLPGELLIDAPKGPMSNYLTKPSLWWET